MRLLVLAAFLALAKTTLGDEVADVRASDRLTQSAVCLVAPEHGPDRRLEKILADAGRLDQAQKPILEINPHHELIARLAAAQEKGTETAYVENVIRLLLDEARILDGVTLSDARGFADRLSQVLTRSL